MDWAQSAAGAVVVVVVGTLGVEEVDDGEVVVGEAGVEVVVDGAGEGEVTVGREAGATLEPGAMDDDEAGPGKVVAGAEVPTASTGVTAASPTWRSAELRTPHARVVARAATTNQATIKPRRCTLPWCHMPHP